MSDITDLDRAVGGSGVTREELLKRAAVGGAVLVAGGSLVKSAPGRACGRRGLDAEARRHVPHRRLGRVGEGLHRRSEHRHASRSGADRDGLGDARRLRRGVQAQVRRARRGDHAEQEGHRLDDPRPRRDRVPQRQDARRGGRRLLAAAADQQEARPLRRRCAGLARPEADEDDGQADRPLHAEAGGRHDPRRARPVHRRHRPGRLQPDRGRQGEPEHRHRPVQGAELHAGPAERPRPQPELLADGAAVLRQGRWSSTSPTTPRG